MPTESTQPLISVPALDIWSFLFERSSLEFPEDHVIFMDITAQKSHGYREIRDSSEKIGRSLRHNWHWQKGDVMAVFTPNCADIGAMTYGTLWAGGVVCPINNLCKAEELAGYLKSSGAKGLTTHVSCIDIAMAASRAVGLPLDRIVLVGDPDPKARVRHFLSLQSTTEGLERFSISPKDLAFLVYSSGTTGLPKGVMLSHENMVANILQNSAMDEGHTKWSSDRNIGFLPMYHIYGLAVLVLLPVYRGITVYIMQRFDLEQFCQNIEQNKITLTFVVPPVVLLLAKHPLVDKYNLSSLRMMHSSAAPLTDDLVQMIYKRLKVPIKQGYGLSEASPGVAAQKWDKWDKPTGSVGNLLPSMAIKFMNGEDEVQAGEQGEIWIKGPNICKGYYKNPKATAESINREGWYRTGDVGYIDRHNNIFITDRMKELIKYNGYQVSPAQLEGLLLGHPAVNDVAVIGVYSKEKATELPRAYVMVAKGYASGKELEIEIIKWMGEKVSPYKRLRGGIRFVDVIPKSAAGKVLRKVLVEKAKMEELQFAGRAKM